MKGCKNIDTFSLKEEQQESQYLSSIPGMVNSIKKAAAEPMDTCIPYNPAERW
ncbi:hypothetical protein [Evtepia sp.]|uniref:hypothetical protein n=1 Tax=Evtepia sp. TaxID=2773933 RepID=UPI002426F0EF|nr:hypothetical protein [Evtepia sp.]MBS4878807.1 hypothetical protein [Bacillota bacterium]MEE0256214.1 hypothetical protein [Evtepia sp.]MEE1368140.1 hypothetical protein [Evtepia sp.]